MLLITEDATIVCGHGGRAAVAASQRWVTVQGRALLVATDPEAKGISGCPFLASGQPCVGTAGVTKGYSTLLRVDGRAVCRADVEGPTLPLRVAHYTVARPAQAFVTETP